MVVVPEAKYGLHSVTSGQEFIFIAMFDWQVTGKFCGQDHPCQDQTKTDKWNLKTNRQLI